MLQRDLEKAQNSSSRLSGFLARLQQLGISPAGRVPQRDFMETLLDAAGTLLQSERIVFFGRQGLSNDLVPLAYRGVTPDAASRLLIRYGEGTLGKAAQALKPVLQLQGAPMSGQPPVQSGSPESLCSGGYMIFPFSSQGVLTGLLLATAPTEGSFSTEARDTASLLAGEAALVLENHGLYADREDTYRQMMRAFEEAIEAKDHYTRGHSDRTRKLVRAVAEDLKLPDVLIRYIEQGAMLHDIGKIGIPDAIILKPGDLTPEEYAVMKKHPQIGHRIVSAIERFRPVSAIVLYHQEWFNGNGYPEGLAGEEIPLGARIVQIIDAWDAMTSDRPYRNAMPKSAAIAELRRQAGSQFDPKLVELFLRVIDRLERDGVPTTEQKNAPATV